MKTFLLSDVQERNDFLVLEPFVLVLDNFFYLIVLKVFCYVVRLCFMLSLRFFSSPPTQSYQFLPPPK